MLGFVVFSLFFFFSPLCLSCTLSSFFFRGEQLQPAGKKSCKDAVGDQNVSRGCCAFSRRLLSEVARQLFLSFLPFFFFFFLVFIAPRFICMSRFFLFKFGEQKFVQRDVFVTPPSLLRPDLKTVKYLSYSE